MGKELKIIGYKDEDFSSKLGEYKCKINPSSYKHDHSITFNEKKTAIGTSKQLVEYEGLATEKISFDLDFDGTGVIPDSGDVVDEIKKLKEVAYYYVGDIHKPAYLQLEWNDNFTNTEKGKQFFRGHLTSMNITYSLFKPDGTPLRAKASLGFEEFKQAKIVSKDNKSPDMTHFKVVKEGDTLPNLCFEVYQDSSFYLQVAEINNLDNFRELQPGKRLMFPPIKLDSVLEEN